MPIFDSQSIQSVVLHRIGNKAVDEGYVLSKSPLQITDQLQDLLARYFITPFKVEEYYNLYDEDNQLDHNEVYRHCSNIFANPETLFEESKQIAVHLYDQTLNANIKGGDFFVVYFDQCQFNGQETSAIGLFKSENKEAFLKVQHGDEEWSRNEGDNSGMADYHLEVHQGININKLDKGALIFNLEEENGYIVSVVDATNRVTDAAYWRDGFLHLQQRQDEYYQTHEVMRAYKEFVKEMPNMYEDVTNTVQADLLNRSVDYFKKNDNFVMEDFAEQVLQQPEVIKSFNEYRQNYEQENDIQLQDQFEINDSAVKKQARSFKSVIKLDKNFHIYVHGDSQLIEQGEDDRGKFYKVYYKEEILS